MLAKRNLSTIIAARWSWAELLMALGSTFVLKDALDELLRASGAVLTHGTPEQAG